MNETIFRFLFFFNREKEKKIFPSVNVEASASFIVSLKGTCISLFFYINLSPAKEAFTLRQKSRGETADQTEIGERERLLSFIDYI